MKKLSFTLIAMAYIAICSVSCSSDDDVDMDSEPEQKGRVLMTFSATHADFNSATRTEVSGMEIHWQENDTVTVWDDSLKNEFTVKPESDKTKAKITGEAEGSAQHFIAVYPHSVGRNCSYVASEGKITGLVIPSTQTATSNTWDPEAAIMTATATKENKKLDFKTVCAYLKITTDEAYKRIELSSEGGDLAGVFSVTDASTGDVEVTNGKGVNFVALVPASGSTTITNGTYYIAMAPGKHKLKLTCYTDNTSKEQIVNEATILKNKVYTLGSTSTPISSLYYSVSFTKKVMFTTGNLYWDGSNYQLETSQIAYPTTWNTNHVGHFYWSKTASVAYALEYDNTGAQENDEFFFKEGSNLFSTTVGGESKELYVLTGGSTDREWFYLLNTRANASNLRKVADVTDGTTTTKCLVIAPDGYSETLQGSYTLSEINSKHLTCLPQAGWRNGTAITTTDGSSPSTDGQSASAYCTASSSNSNLYAYKLFLHNGNYTMAALPRNIGSPIRLVWTVSN